jgi:hypothetical protein
MLPAMLLALGLCADPPRFEVQTLTTSADVRAVESADLDGDGKLDLVATLVAGTAPHRTRAFAIFWNQGGSFSSAPDLILPAPADLCTFDLAEVDGRPGAKLLSVTPTGLRALSFVNRVASGWTELVSQPSVFTRAPEGELPRLAVAQSLGASTGLALLLPGPASLSVYQRQGQGWSRISTLEVDVEGGVETFDRPGHRAHQGGIPSFAVTTRFPEVHVVDVDGDGLMDLVLSRQAHVDIYRQTAYGHFPARPDAQQTFELAPADKEPGDGSELTLQLLDLDGDGRADALVTRQVMSGITSARTEVGLFSGALTRLRPTPDQVITSDGASFGAVQILESPSGGKALVIPSVKFGILSIVRMLTSKSVKVRFGLYPMTAGVTLAPKRFSEAPTAERDLTFHLDLDGSRSTEAVDMDGDYDGDGIRDLAFGEGDGLTLYSGKAGGELFARTPMAHVPVRPQGRLRAWDLDATHRSSMVLWYPGDRGHRREIAVAHNRAPSR